MLRYGIPEFRLPREVLDAEIAHIAGLGVSFRTGCRLGADLAVEQLLEQYDAVLLAAGCYRSNRLGAAGEDLNGVVSGLEFMMDVTAGRPPEVGETVLVIGDGFTAFDCARTSLRLGAKDVRICSRLTREDLIVTKDEVVEAEREGVRFEFLLTATRINGEKSVAGVEFLRTRLGDIGADGRREAAPIEGSEFTIAADTVIAAIGQRPEPLAVPGARGGGPVAADADTYRAAARGLYVAGDYLSGPSTVIEAVAMGRRAAWKIVGDHGGSEPRRQAVRIEETKITDRERTWDFLPRQEMPSLPVAERFASGEKEVERGFSRETAKKEAQRCYLCYLHYEIDMERCIYCRYCIDVAPRDCIKLVREVRLDDDGSVAELVETESWHDVNAVVIDNEQCIRCGACMRACPVECISVSKVEMVERREESRRG
jgi:NAD-dependent dihydropyrimidine dehydrogenase PreA subunit/thioredoxin reductase